MSDDDLERLLAHVRDTRAFDFTGYKRASLMRRVRKRMQAVVILERVAGREQPPDAVELQPLQRELADGAMRGMRRVEGATEQADALHGDS